MATRPGGLLVVPEGRVRRAQGRAGRARAAAPLVRRPGLRGLPGHPRLAGVRLRRRQGGPAPHGGRGAGLPGRDLRHRGQPALLDRGAAGVLSLRPGRAHRRPERRSRARSAARNGTRPPRRCRTSTPTTATSTPRSQPEEIRRTGPDGNAGGGPALDHPGGLAGHDQQGRDRRQRRHPRAGDPGGDRHAPGRSLQPRAADPLLSERLQPGLLPAAAAVARTSSRRPTAWTWTSSSGWRSAAPATSISAPRWGRAPASAASSAWRSPTCSAGASGASCSGSSARTSTTSP